VPREGDPRIIVRLSRTDAAVIEAAASEANVAVGALVRECAVRYAGTVARQIASGEVTGLRRQRIEVAEAAAPVVRASVLVESEADRVGRERQERVNAMTARARASRKPPAGGRR
jgi:hypothetical protein